MASRRGVWDVLVPLILAEFVVGSGRYSTSRGVVGMVQGVGGSLSNVATGVAVVAFGYAPTFALLAGVALLALALVLRLPEPEAVKARRLARAEAG